MHHQHGLPGENAMRRRAWITGLLATLAGGAVQAETWHCRNDVEVQCGVDGCSAAAEGGFTPMDLAFGDDGGLSLCAYSGCWEGNGEVLARAPWLVVGARGLPWSDPHGAPDRTSDVLVAFDPNDRVALVKAGAWALPMRCAPAARGNGDAE